MDKPLALIIEDDTDLAAIFSKSLQGGGFATEIIRDGRTAIQRLAGTPPLVVVLDLHLPYVTGPAILKQIRADEHLAKTAVIVTTADAQLADDMRAQADLVLLKPVSVDQLRELAKRMLRRWQEDKEAEDKS